MLTAETEPMGRKKSKTAGKYVMTRYDGELLRKARSVLALRGSPMLLAEYISENSRKQIEADYDREVEKAKSPKPTKD